MKDNELVPITIDEIRRLHGTEKVEALRLYHSWLKRQRKTDKRIKYNLDNKIWRFKNPTKWKQVKKKHRYKDNNTCVDCNKIITNYATKCHKCKRR